MILTANDNDTKTIETTIEQIERQSDVFGEWW